MKKNHNLKNSIRSLLKLGIVVASLILILIFSNTTYAANIYSDNIIPAMTNNIQPAPFIITTSTDYYGYAPPYKAFDHNNTTTWATSTKPSSVKVDMGAKKKVEKIQITPFNVSGLQSGSVKNWNLYGSNDDKTYTLITNGVQPNITDKTPYEFINNNSYRYYKFEITDGYLSNIGLAELEMFEVVGTISDVPAALSATPGDKLVKLKWDAVSEATGYNVKWGTASGTYTNSNTVTDATYYTVPELKNGTTYYFAVSALKGTTESANSSEVSATPQAVKPNAPATLSATPGDKIVQLKWDAVSGATGYNVKWGTTAGTYTNSNTVTDATYYTVPGLKNGTTYYFAVSAQNGTVESVNSTEISANPQAAKPSAPTLSTTTVNAAVTLSWNSIDNATGYVIKRSTIAGGPYTLLSDLKDTKYTDLTVKSGTTYYYVVSAINETVQSDNSNEVSATPIASNILKLVLEVNEVKQFSVSSYFSENSEVTWTSSDTSIVTVDQNGKIKALKPGNIIITCTSKDGSYTNKINVLVVDLSYQLAVDLTIGDKCRLTVDTLANASNVTWASSDTAIATTSATGKVTAISEGLTYIIASDGQGKEIGRIYIRVRK